MRDPVGMYGPFPYIEGVISEHLRGLEVRTLAGGRIVALVPEGKRVRAWPVLCSELIWINTEDGRMDGRCGCYVSESGYACEGHAQERQSWNDMSELEKYHWEMAREDER